MSIKIDARARLLVCTVLASAGVSPALAQAQTATTTNEPHLEEIVVTAQKREQNLQDVPIAVTAITQSTLQANRITSVTDLTAMAPGLTVRTAAGGSQLPSFALRGAISYGVVPGSDKEVSIYVDGVYISSARGAIFDLPDISRIEMLRGPQGTLFGRNATAGAVSITTRDPDGKFGVTGSATVGNYDINRERLSVSLPQMGPFSAYFSVTHDYKRGDIENAGAGQVWDRTAGGGGVQTSPRWLGTKNSTSFFGALKFEPSSDFTTVYKFDYNHQTGTPEGTGLVGINQNVGGPYAALVPLLNAVLTGQDSPVYIAADGKRPKIVNNSWAVDTKQKAYGHNLTSVWHAGDNLTIKNVAAFRHSEQTNATPLDGFSGLTFTEKALNTYATSLASSATPGFASLPAATQQAIVAGYAGALGQQFTVGAPFVGLGTEPQSSGNQWSDELQINYNSELLTVTAGAMWFHSKERTGYLGIPNTVSFETVPGGVITGEQGTNYNRATSIAAYSQVEVHVTPQVDIIGGIRDTQDKKSGKLVYGATGDLTTVKFKYKKTKPNFLLGVNYKPTNDVLLYGKYSTSFVSGGSVSGLEFKPETAKSWEAGVKADMFDRRLRANLAVYTVKYEHVQDATLASNFPELFPADVDVNSIGTIIIDQGGPVKAKGFELELTAAPVRGLTVGGNLSYTDTKFKDVNQVLIDQALGDYQPAQRSKWTGTVWAQYVTPPVFDDAVLSFRMDASYHSMFWQTQNQKTLIAAFDGINKVPSSWKLNGRVALSEVTMGNATGELALWVKNLTQNRESTFALQTLNLIGSTTFTPARTFGVDLTVKY